MKRLASVCSQGAGERISTTATTVEQVHVSSVCIHNPRAHIVYFAGKFRQEPARGLHTPWASGSAGARLHTWMPWPGHQDLAARTLPPEWGCQGTSARTWMLGRSRRDLKARTLLPGRGCQDVAAGKWPTGKGRQDKAAWRGMPGWNTRTGMPGLGHQELATRT